MNLKDYVEVEWEFNEIVLSSASTKTSKLQSSFEEKIREKRIVPSKQLLHMEIDSRNYIVCQLYVGGLDQVLVAYCIEPIGTDLVIHGRRFERANVVGKALFGIAKNVFSGKPRTLQREINLVKQTSRFIKGMTSPSPLSTDSLFMADIYIDLINDCLKEAIAEI
jgi:hypothetical protein